MFSTKGSSKRAIYEFQLEEVRAKLLAEPNSTKLQDLEKKLLKMILLSEKLSEPMLKSQNIKTQTKPEQEKRETFGTTEATEAIKYQTGDKCEAFWEGKWYESTIQNVSSDHQIITVIFTGIAEAAHLSRDKIRPYDPKTATKRPYPIQKRPETLDNLAKKTPSLSNYATAFPSTGTNKRNKPTKEEHIKKKEQEHVEKQESWQKFSQKMGINKKKT